MKKLFVLTPVLTLLFAFNTALADRTVWYVHPDSALNSIQAGLDSCADNDIVLVGPGTYVENIIWPNTQGIHLISELGPEMTILDGDSIESVILCSSDIDTTTMIRGFTIQNGRGTVQGPPWYWVGGGIYCHNSSPSIIGNIIKYNFADFGGGIYCENDSSLICDNVITENFSCEGGGIDLLNSSSNITGNVITYNTTPYYDGWGGGIFVRNSSLKITNNIITNNAAPYGGGIYSWGSSPTITSCTIANNDNEGVLCRDTYNFEILHIHYCDIFNNDGYGIKNLDTIWVDATYNWWGDSTGPYHPDSNPGGLGDTVSDYVDFIPWLYWPGVEEQPSIKSVITHNTVGATIFAGPLLLPAGKKCQVFDVSGRAVMPDKIKPGIYFVEIDGEITQKVVKIR